MANYNWEKDSIFEITGEQFGIVQKYIELEVLKAQGNTSNEFDRIHLLEGSFTAIQEIFNIHREKGLIVEQPEEQKKRKKGK